MKTRIAFFCILTFAGALWAVWSFAYQRGYSQGARDEFECWKQLPTRFDNDWDGTLVGHRVARLLPGGKNGSTPSISIRDQGVNNIPSGILP